MGAELDGGEGGEGAEEHADWGAGGGEDVDGLRGCHGGWLSVVVVCVVEVESGLVCVLFRCRGLYG